MRLFRREWIFPALVIAFVSTSARAGRDGLAAQAASDLECNTVSIAQASPFEFIAAGCGQDATYDCQDDGDCVRVDDAPASVAASSDDADDDAAADAFASALTDMACACASAGLAHGSHASSSSHHSHRSHASSSRHEVRTRETKKAKQR